MLQTELTKEQWNEYWNKAYGYFYRRLDNKIIVEDLTTLALEDFFMYKGSVENAENLFWTITKRRLAAHLREKYRSKLNEASTYQDDEVIVSLFEDSKKECGIFYQQRIKLLMDCVNNNLKEVDKTTVEMAVMFDFKSPEIAKELECESGAVRTRLTRALKKLRQSCTKLWK